MDLLEPVLSHDEWGSRTAIASLRGQPTPTELPQSELWMGAHESGPSGLTRDGTSTVLSDVIAQDPEGELGADCAQRFGGRLPFLLKVLAPSRAISIQAHPTAAQAQEVRARDAVAGEPNATYVDDWAKPEMLVALTPFRVFVGLRTPAEVGPLVERLGCSWLSTMVSQAARSDRPAHALLAAVLDIDPSDRIGRVREVIAACRSMESDNPDANSANNSKSADEIGEHCAAIVAVADDHPDDLGLVVLLLMHHRVLQPGEHIDVAAGVLHSYASGLGVEVLANSDNVVRAGLTTKHLDIPELLRIVNPDADGLLGHAEEDPDLVGAQRFPTHSDRFALRKIIDPQDLPIPGDGTPRIVFCLRGDVTLTSREHTLALGPVRAAYLSARDQQVTLTGTGEVYLVTVATV